MDVKVKCKGCGESFVVTEREAKWYEEKGFELPKRCLECRKNRRKNKSKSKENRYESTEV